MLKKISILGIGITNEDDENISEYILERLKLDKKFYIVTPNPEIIFYANRHESYRKVLNNAEISLADGTGLFLASIFLGKPLKQRIPGVNFVEELCKKSVRKPVSIGFLGGRRVVALRSAERLLKKYPGLDIVFVSEEWGEEGFKWRDQAKKSEKTKSRSEPSRSSIDLLFVAFGHPKQEEWIAQNLDKLPVKAAMGVGGAFDYLSGRVKRAPFMLRALGLEWLYRLIKEPWRWKRQLALIEFTKLVWREMWKRD